MGFYRLHLLEIVTIEFLIVPLLLVVGGTFGFFTAVFGFYATSKEDSCLLVTHAVFMSINFGLLLAGMVSSVRLIFFIKTGLFNSDVIPDMNMYETNAWVRYRWDTLQCKELQIEVAAICTQKKAINLYIDLTQFQMNLLVAEVTVTTLAIKIGNIRTWACNTILYQIHVACVVLLNADGVFSVITTIATCTLRFSPTDALRYYKDGLKHKWL